MTVNVNSIINIALVAILVICGWQGYKKGIIMGIVQVLVIVLSLYGAQVLSDTYSYEVIPVLRPFVSGYMENQLDTNTYLAFGYVEDENTGRFDAPYSTTDLLANNPDMRQTVALRTYQSLGLYDDMAQTLTDRTMAYAQENNASLTSSVVTIACQSITWYAGFLLAFILLFSILTVIINLPNLSFKIPYIGIVNDLGGLAIGLFVGAIFCSVIVWVFQFAGLVLPEDSIRATGLAGFFLDKNLLASYITL